MLESGKLRSVQGNYYLLTTPATDGSRSLSFRVFLNIHFVEISVGNDVIKVVVDYGGQIYDKNNYQTEQT